MHGSVGSKLWVNFGFVMAFIAGASLTLVVTSVGWQSTDTPISHATLHACAPHPHENGTTASGTTEPGGSPATPSLPAIRGDTSRAPATPANVAPTPSTAPAAPAVAPTPSPSQQPKRDPFWSKVAFVIRTGKNVMDKRLPGGLLTWVPEVGADRVIVVSDHSEPAGRTFNFHNRQVVLPEIYNGVDPFADPADEHSKPGAAAWDRDFVKHLSSYDLLLEKFPDADWFVMVDDDTYPFLSRMKEILEDERWRDVSQKRLVGMCYGLDPKAAHWCDAFPTGPEARNPAGGAGMAMTRAGMLAMKEVLPMCYKKYANCWAGDRRLGACMYDAKVTCQMGTSWDSRDVQQTIDADKTWYLTSLHHMSSMQSIFVHDFLEGLDEKGPGRVNNGILGKQWTWIQNWDTWN